MARGKGTLFQSQIAVKGKEYSKDSYDVEVILAHYRVDKPFKRFYQL